jgi:V/A-type H+-transporting ATPase subunit E
MSEHIQPLLERIQSEGLKKAEAERETLLADAQNKSDAILSEARKQAENIVEKAESEAKAHLKRGTTALEQSARDLLLRLRTEIGRQLKLAAQQAASATLSSEELIQDLLPELAKRGSGNVRVEASDPLADKLKTLLPALLKDAGKGGEVIMNPKTGAGFQLQFEGSPEGIDFTAESVAEWISAGLRPELAELLRPETSGS